MIPVLRAAALLLVLSLPQASSAAGFDRCPQLFPQHRLVEAPDRQWRAVGLCSTHFAALVSARTKTPLIVVERLNRAMLREAQGEPRSNEFYADLRLPAGERAELVDFKGSGLDRGHLANAADQPDAASMRESFALSNMVPQDPGSNRKGAWLKAEKDTRKYVLRQTDGGDVYVFSGPLFRGPLRTIGPNRVWVPSHLFKLVFDERRGRAWAHIVPNTAEARLGPPIAYADFVLETGWAVLDARALAAHARPDDRPE